MSENIEECKVGKIEKDEKLINELVEKKLISKEEAAKCAANCGILPSEKTKILNDSLSDPRLKATLMDNNDNFEVKKPNKVYIVGFAPTWVETPWADGKNGTAEIWGLNELYKIAEGHNGENFNRWFEIHNPDSPSKKTPEHHAFMENCHIPLYLQKKDERFPNSVKYPLEEITEFFEKKGFNGANYFTNSISYMIALAIYEGFKEIHIYGVDMAQSSEYSHQRPSCEYFIALAEGLGIKVVLPQNSDLVKTGMMYGYADNNQMRIKMKSRIKELKDRRKQMNNDLQNTLAKKAQLEAGLNQVSGAIDDTNFYLTNWSN